MKRKPKLKVVDGKVDIVLIQKYFDWLYDRYTQTDIYDELFDNGFDNTLEHIKKDFGIK